MRTAWVVAFVLYAAAAHADEPKWPSEEARRWGEQAMALQKQAQQEKNDKKYEEAHGLYQKYLARYPDVNDGELSYLDAELLFKLQRWDEAAKMYERVVALAPKGRHAKAAAYADVIAIKNILPKPSAERPCADTEMKPCAISPLAQRMLAAFDRYLAVVPESGERSSIEYRKARIYYEHQHFAEAAPIFDHIFVAYPEHELATYSANLEMDCLAILKRYDELRALVERIKKSPSMKDEVTQKQVQQMDAGLKKKGK